MVMLKNQVFAIWQILWTCVGEVSNCWTLFVFVLRIGANRSSIHQCSRFPFRLLVLGNPAAKQ
jgi:hypothetical protein